MQTIFLGWNLKTDLGLTNKGWTIGRTSVRTSGA